jgi:hypothetical protein
VTTKIRDQNIIALRQTGYVALEDFPRACETMQLYRNVRRDHVTQRRAGLIYKYERLV